MTEASDLDAARVEFMNCAVEAAAGKGGKDEELEAREACIQNRIYVFCFFQSFGNYLYSTNDLLVTMTNE